MIRQPVIAVILACALAFCSCTKKQGAAGPPEGALVFCDDKGLEAWKAGESAPRVLLPESVAIHAAGSPQGGQAAAVGPGESIVWLIGPKTVYPAWNLAKNRTLLAPAFSVTGYYLAAIAAENLSGAGDLGDLVVGTAEGQAVLLARKVAGAAWINGSRTLVATEGDHLFEVTIENMVGPKVSVSAPLYKSSGPIRGLCSDVSGIHIGWIEGSKIMRSDPAARQVETMIDFLAVPGDRGVILPEYMALAPTMNAAVVAASSGGNGKQLYLVRNKTAVALDAAANGAVSWVMLTP